MIRHRVSRLSQLLFGRFGSHALLGQTLIVGLILSVSVVSLFSLGLAQRTGAVLLGEVSGGDGQPVSGAEVVIQNIETGVTRVTRTDESGRYRIALIRPGHYKVGANLENLTSEPVDVVHLQVADERTLDLVLRIDRIGRTITVTSELPSVELNSVSLGQIVGNDQIRGLPLNGRDITQLGLLDPGVLTSRGSTRDINVGFGMKVSVSGSRPNQNLFTMDGTDANDALNNTPAGATGQVTGVETIQEFRIVTNTLSAEYGRVSGGVYNIVTRSGSNQLSGSLFWFHRNDNLDARSFFDAEKPEFRRNQFGFSLGGPVWKDRTFFFGSYEALREVRGVSQIAFVPDMEVREAEAGDTIVFDSTGKSVVLQSEVLPLLNLYPVPTGSEVSPGTHIAEYKGVLNRLAHEDFFNIRVDHTFSETDNLFVRYQYSDSEFLLPVLFPEYPNLAANRRQLVTIGETHSSSTGMVNEFQIGFNRSTPSEKVPTPPADKNIPLIEGRDLGSVRVTAGDGLPGLTEVGTDRTNPKSFFNNTFQIHDNLFLSRGRHQLKFGFLLERFHFNGSSETRTRGRLEFSSLSRLLGDDPRRIEGASSNSDFDRGFRQWLFGFFVQDDFKVTPRLTLFGGLRWEFVSTPHEVNGKMSNLTDYRDPNAKLIVEDPRFADDNAPVPQLCCRPLFDNPTLGNIGPRLGLAWDVLGTRRTVLRAGFGVFYEQPLFSIYRSPMFRSLPFVERSRLSPEDWPGGPSTASLPIDPELFASSGAGQQTEAFQYELNRTYVLQYNLGIQQELARDIVASISYVGSRGVNLFGRGDTNLAIPEYGDDGQPVFPDDERRNENFDSVRTNLQGFNSWYHALQMKFETRFARDLNLKTSYSFSRCIDELSSIGGRQEQRFGQTRTFDPFNRARDKGVCDFHVQHNLVVNHLITLPTPKSLGRLPAALLGGWQLNGILNLASGIPFTPSVVGDPDGDGSDDNGARPDLTGDPLSGNCPNGAPVGSPDCWFNPLAFAFPGAGVRGDLGRNTLLGPGISAYDVAFVKRAPLGEKLDLEFRLEIFNTFNRANLNPPSNSEDGARIFSEDGTLDPTGAMISERSGTSTGPREFQLGIRLVF